MSEVYPATLPRPDYSYIDHVVRTIRISADVVNQPTLPIEPGPLVSIHLQSNRPDNITSFMENLVASLDDPSRVEVVLKIDDTDKPMNKLLPELVEKYKHIITLKYISTPLVGGFFELWRSMNDMLLVCHPYAYFLWNMNDEMAVLNKGWDTALAKYVGLFPDHLFRLRTSLFRSRNYYDFWECGFAPETSAITTKRWIELCGNWNPCLGPDSFNQCVAYYFGYHDRFYKHRVDRDIPIHDFVFAGEGAFIGLEGDALYRRARGAAKAWFRLMSYDIQQDASRRSQHIMAHIWAHRELKKFTITDDKFHRRFIVHNTEENKVAYLFNYGLPKWKVKLTNLYRATAYYYYAGGGQQGTPYSRFRQIIGFLALRYNFFNRFRAMWVRHRGLRQKLKYGMLHVLVACKLVPVSWGTVNAAQQKKLSSKQVLLALPKRIVRVLVTKGFNRGIRFHSSVFSFDRIHAQIDWAPVHQLFGKVAWPPYFRAVRVQEALFKCLLLQRWYRLDDTQLQDLLGHNLAFQRFIGVPLNEAIPSLASISEFRSLLVAAQVEQELYRKTESCVKTGELPRIAIYNSAPAASGSPVYEKYSA